MHKEAAMATPSLLRQHQRHARPGIARKFIATSRIATSRIASRGVEPWRGVAAAAVHPHELRSS
jgi:hypothetical protein